MVLCASLDINEHVFYYTDDSQSWKSKDSTKLVARNKDYDYRLMLSEEAEFNSIGKWNTLRLDNHLKASVTAGLIEDLKGASCFVNDRPDPRKVTLTIVWTYKTREEFYVDLQSLASQEDSRTDMLGNRYQPESEGATHLVVSVFYGAETILVLSLDLDGEEDDEEIRKEAAANLSKIMDKFLDAMRKHQEVANFKKELILKEEKHLLARLKCRVYADLQIEPVVECSIFDAYKLVNQASALCSGKSNVPIAIQLCPLKVLLDGPAGKNVSTGFDLYYRDMPDYSVANCCEVLSDLKRMIIKVEILMEANSGADCSTLREFAALVSKYHQDVKAAFKTSVIAARRNSRDGLDGRKIAEMAEKHPLFSSSRLQNWLSYKEGELETTEWIASRAGEGITVMSHRNQLSQQRGDNCSKRYALVLFVPSLDEKTNSVLSAMKKCADQKFCESHDKDTGIKNEEQSWFLMQQKRKFLLARIREFASYVKKNQSFSDQVEWIVTFSESSRPFSCSYSIYESGKPLKEKIERLPGPPTGLRLFHPHSPASEAKRAKTTFSSVCLEWDNGNLGFPCNFLVEYRKKGTLDAWIQLKTTEPDQRKVTIDLETESTMEIRVAANTCIGCSEFSDIVDTTIIEKEMIDKEDALIVPPPIGLKVTSVTDSAAKLEWTHPPGNLFCPTYRIVYWKKEEKSSNNEEETDYHENFWWLENLDSETTYQFHVVTISYYESKKSEPSETLEFTTAQWVRFPLKLVKRCKKIKKNEEGKNLYAVPIDDVTGQLTTAKCFSFSAGDDNGPPLNDYQLTILLVGDSHSGKAELINSMINRIFELESEDSFRFQLIDPDSPGNEKVNVYEIHLPNCLTICIGFSLKIVDIPNYSDDDPVKNQAITEMFRNYMDDKDVRKKVDVVGFVMDSAAQHLTPTQGYIHCSLMEIFGNDVIRNLKFLLNNAENEDPSLWSEVVDARLVTFGPFKPRYENRHKFNRSLFFSSNDDSSSVDSECSYEVLDNFDPFLASLEVGPSFKSLSKRLAKEERRLVTVLTELVPILKVQWEKLEEVLYTKLEISEFPEICTKNEDVKLTVEGVTARRVDVPIGEYVFNCETCQMTCHSGFGLGLKKYFSNCDVVDHSKPRDIRTCRVCPGQCSTASHQSQYFKWVFQYDCKTVSSLAIKKEYEEKLKRKLNFRELLAALDADIETKKNEFVEQVELFSNYYERLNELAKHFDSNSISQCFDVVDDFIRHFNGCSRFSEHNFSEEMATRFKNAVRAVVAVRRQCPY